MRKLLFAIVTILGAREVFGQASPYNIQLFKAQTFTASGQTGAVLALNGLTTGSTVGSSYSSANVTVSGTSLTTATFSVQGSADNGTTYFPLNISALATPGTVATTITVTGPGIYQFNPSGLTHIKLQTSGTFTATSLSLQVGLSPNGIIARGGSGGGSMVYPDAGIPVSTGTSWASSKTAPSGDIVGTTDTQTLTNKTVDGVSPTTFGYLDPTSSVQTQLNSKVGKAGDTMTGPLILAADPTNNLGAATKQYVDSHSAGVTSFNTRTGTVTLVAADVNAVGAITNSTSGNAATATFANGYDTRTNGNPNGSTAFLNITSGDGITITNSGGNVTIASGPSFAISSFTTPTTSLEIGATLTNPSFTVSYSLTPSSANITNTDSISSPTTLSSPYTSGTVTGSFVKHAQTSTTFTLNATGNSISKTSNIAVNWLPRTFGGVGTTGATSCTASGNNCTLSTSGTLSDAGIVSTVVNKSYGPYSPTGGQKIYVATPGSCTHSSWVDTVSGFALIMNSGTSFSFTNQNSDSVSMCLYASVNTYISGSYGPKPTN